MGASGARKPPVYLGVATQHLTQRTLLIQSVTMVTMVYVGLISQRRAGETATLVSKMPLITVALTALVEIKHG